MQQANEAQRVVAGVSSLATSIAADPFALLRDASQHSALLATIASHTKELCDLQGELRGKQPKNLPAVVVSGVDTEQLWAQLEHRNQQVGKVADLELNRLQQQVGQKAKADAEEEDDEQEESEEAESEEEEGEDREEGEGAEEEGESEGEGEEMEEMEEGGPEAEPSEEEEEEDAGFLQHVSDEEAEGKELGDEEADGEELDEEEAAAQKELNQAKAVLEADGLFNLDHMEAFLDEQDEAAMQMYEWEEKQQRKQRGQEGEEGEEMSDSEEDDDEHEVVIGGGKGNRAQDEEWEDDEMDILNGWGVDRKDGAEASRYTDFFDPPLPKGAKVGRASARAGDNDGPDDEEDEDDEREGWVAWEREEENGEEQGSQEQSGGDEEGEAQEGEDEEDGEEGGLESAFERKQRVMAERIHKLEEDSLKPRNWQLMGEANARKRPVNSLLHADLEFEQRVRPAPLISEETTRTIESIIRERVASGVFDDVVRRLPPNPDSFRPARARLSQEKSKESLAEIYAKEFAQKVLGKEPQNKLKKAHSEVQSLWEDLCSHLDALTNYQFLPPRVDEEMKVNPNVAAMSLEEAMPDSFSEAQALAPEEVFRKQKGDLKGESEMSREDKKRKRSTNKRRSRKRKLDEEQKDKAREASGKKRVMSAQESQHQALEKLKKDGGRNVKIAKSNLDGKEFSTSTKFFAKLQQTEKGEGGSGGAGGKQKKGKGDKNVSKSLRL